MCLRVSSIYHYSIFYANKCNLKTEQNVCYNTSTSMVWIALMYNMCLVTIVNLRNINTFKKTSSPKLLFVFHFCVCLPFLLWEVSCWNFCSKNHICLPMFSQFLSWTFFLERSARRLNFSLDHVSAPKLIYLSPKLKTFKLNKVGTKTCCVFPNWKYRMKKVFSNVFDWVGA